MRDLSLHILDVAENGLRAGANQIRISITEDSKANRLEVVIADNGHGIPEDKIPEIVDPFFTTRTTRRVGLGLSLFQEAARRSEGDFELRSREGAGTEVKATFQLDHIDRPPLGDMGGTLISLIAGYENVDFAYTHVIDDRRLDLDMREIKEELQGVPIHHPEVIRYLRQTICDFLSGT